MKEFSRQESESSMSPDALIISELENRVNKLNKEELDRINECADLSFLAELPAAEYVVYKDHTPQGKGIFVTSKTPTNDLDIHRNENERGPIQELKHCVDMGWLSKESFDNEKDPNELRREILENQSISAQKSIRKEYSEKLDAVYLDALRNAIKEEVLESVVNNLNPVFVRRALSYGHKLWEHQNSSRHTEAEWQSTVNLDKDLELIKKLVPEKDSN